MNRRNDSRSSEAELKASCLVFYDAIYPGTLGGVEHRNHQLAAALGARGHHVVLAGWTKDSESPAMGVTIRSIGRPRILHRKDGRRSSWLALKLAWNAARIDLSNIDLVETANIPYLHLFPLSFRCRRAGIPLIVTWHEFWGDYWQDYLGRAPLGLWRLHRWIEERAARRGERVVAVSRMTAQRLASIRGETIEVVPNGIPLGLLRQVKAPGRVAADTTSAAPLVAAGRLVENKRLGLLIDAVALLAPSMRGPILTIIGDGPKRRDLQEQIERLDLVDRVELTGQLGSSHEVWRQMSCAKIAVHPSSREGFGMVPLEAMAMGLPVIYCASPDNAVGETVRDGVDGIEVAPTSTAIASAVRGLLDDEALRTRMGTRATERASMFDWEEIAASVERIWLMNQDRNDLD
jgi:glycosyltransferase involved in cell wall biosynthesis